MNYFQDIGAIKKLKCIFLKKVIVNEIMHLTLITHKWSWLHLRPKWYSKSHRTPLDSLLPASYRRWRPHGGAGYQTAAVRPPRSTGSGAVTHVNLNSLSFLAAHRQKYENMALCPEGVLFHP